MLRGWSRNCGVEPAGNGQVMHSECGITNYGIALRDGHGIYLVHKICGIYTTYKDILLLFQSQAKSVACQPLHGEDTYTKRKGVCAIVLCVSYMLFRWRCGRGYVVFYIHVQSSCVHTLYMWRTVRYV